MLDGVLALTLVICVITDITKRKIYNGILVPAFSAGLLINIFTKGWLGLFSSGQGFILGLAFLLLPFITGGIGAGDVKLLATVGAIKGPYFVFNTFLGMGIAGGIVAVLIMFHQRGILKTIKDIWQGFIVFFATKFKVISFGGTGQDNSFPYGVAIALGVIAAYFVG